MGGLFGGGNSGSGEARALLKQQEAAAKAQAAEEKKKVQAKLDKLKKQAAGKSSLITNVGGELGSSDTLG